MTFMAISVFCRLGWLGAVATHITTQTKFQEATPEQRFHAVFLFRCEFVKASGCRLCRLHTCTLGVQVAYLVSRACQRFIPPKPRTTFPAALGRSARRPPLAIPQVSETQPCAEVLCSWHLIHELLEHERERECGDCCRQAHTWHSRTQHVLNPLLQLGQIVLCILLWCSKRGQACASYCKLIPQQHLHLIAVRRARLSEIFELQLWCCNASPWLWRGAALEPVIGKDRRPPTET